jgi:hypothetical protein
LARNKERSERTGSMLLFADVLQKKHVILQHLTFPDWKRAATASRNTLKQNELRIGGINREVAGGWIWRINSDSTLRN